jgi:ferredoxin-NADP reductase
MQLTLVKKKEEVPGVESFIFKPAEPLSWKAGQFLHYALPHAAPDDRGQDRWFTIASAPFETTPMITTRFAPEKGSTFKRALASLAPGSAIEVGGPEGDFIVEDIAQEYVFIAGGIGITPIHSILKQAYHDGTKLHATLLYSNRDANVPYKAELDTYATNNPNLVIHYITSPDRIDEASIRKFVPELDTPHFYVSGPEPMVKSLHDVITAMGVREDHIKLDDFPGYPAD